MKEYYPALILTIINLSRHHLVQAEVKREIVQIPGDLVLGGLFPMHEQVILVLGRAGQDVRLQDN